MPAELAQPFYYSMLENMRTAYQPELIKDGQFGAYMQVHIQNDGPVTVELESPTGPTDPKMLSKQEKQQQRKEKTRPKPPRIRRGRRPPRAPRWTPAPAAGRRGTSRPRGSPNPRKRLAESAVAET
ncbi:hypothetical protein ANANG_G00051450 [Anguilla anguilla]|uniref:D-aminoacyl-tRNA deacylase n=1 Tax=Anguilla anguilla TaxID=7936 RepID=A0A9D3S5M7_ANGAN|nr:hypothetical protein ANANG_G00051450 [Anguilla anguilla]